MNNDAVFEAEAEIEAYNNSRTRLRPLSKGPDTITSALGEVEPAGQISSEHQPLLAGSNGGAYTTGDSAHNVPANDVNRKPRWSGEEDFLGLPWWRTPSIWWLIPALALFAMSFGATLILKINLILSLVCRQYFCDRSIQDPTFLHMLPILEGEDNPQCRTPEVQSLVSKFTLYTSLISGILSAFTSPKLGELSDRYGRTRTIAFTTLGMFLNEAIFIIVATNQEVLSVNWVLLGSIFDGLGGSFIAAMALSYAYGSDCTPPERRNVVFGYYHACLFGGIALGPLMAAYIVKATGQILSVFYLSIGSHCAFFLYVVFVVPESLSMNRQRIARAKKFIASDESLFKRTLKWSNLLAPLSILWPKEAGTNPALRRNLFFLAAVDTTMFGVAMGSMTVVIIYSEYIFGWGSFETNIFMSAVNICRVTVLIVLLPIITRLVRGPAVSRIQKNSGCDNFDLAIIRLAIFFDLLGYVGYATVRTGSLFIACGVLASIGGMGSPTLQSALTKHVPPDRTGQVLGAMGLLHAAGRVVAPTIFNLIYAGTVGKFTQAVFVCLASTFGLAMIFSWCIRPHVYWDDKTSDLSPDVNMDQPEGPTTTGAARVSEDLQDSRDRRPA